jgi:hypothetical protein
MQMAYEAFADDDPRRRRQHWSRGKEVVRDGDVLHVPLFLMDGPPPSERRFVVDTIGRQTALLTDEERKMRDDALDARDTDYERTMYRGAAPSQGTKLDARSASLEDLKKARDQAIAERNANISSQWVARTPLTPEQRALAVEEGLRRYGLYGGQ